MDNDRRDEFGRTRLEALNAADQAAYSPWELMSYDDAEAIRPATHAEVLASIEAAKHDGGAGVILVDDRRCYVVYEVTEMDEDDDERYERPEPDYEAWVEEREDRRHDEQYEDTQHYHSRFYDR